MEGVAPNLQPRSQGQAGPKSCHRESPGTRRQDTTPLKQLARGPLRRALPPGDASLPSEETDQPESTFCQRVRPGTRQRGRVRRGEDVGTRTAIVRRN
jgi:hypothetical protein